GAWHRGRRRSAAHWAAKRASLRSSSILPDSKPPVGGRCPAAVHKGIARCRQGTLERSGATEGSTWVCREHCGAACDCSNSAASVTSRAARRLLAIFRILFSPACTTYSLPILTIE